MMPVLVESLDSMWALWVRAKLAGWVNRRAEGPGMVRAWGEVLLGCCYRVFLLGWVSSCDTGECVLGPRQPELLSSALLLALLVVLGLCAPADDAVREHDDDLAAERRGERLRAPRAQHHDTGRPRWTKVRRAARLCTGVCVCICTGRTPVAARTSSRCSEVPPTRCYHGGCRGCAL